MKIKKSVSISVSVLVVCFGLFFVNEVKAAVVTDSFEMPVDCKKKCNKRGGIVIPTFLGSVTGQFQKVFNLVKEDGDTVDTKFLTQVGTSLSVDVGPTTGSWVLNGGQYDTPPMDGVEYVGKYFSASEKIYRFRQDSYREYYDQVYNISASNPIDKNEPTLSSSNPDVVSCTSSGCVANSPGTAKITVSFPSESLTSAHGFYGDVNGYGLVNTRGRYVRYTDTKFTETGELENETFEYADSLFDRGAACTHEICKRLGIKNFSSLDVETSPYSTRSFAYSFPDIEYNVTVVSDGNTPHTVSFVNAEASEGSVDVTWSYEDVDGDKQTAYHIQVATDSGFSNIIGTVVSSAGDVSNVRSDIVAVSPNLEAGKTYHARVRSYNAINPVSAWSTGTFVFNDETTTNVFSVSCSAPRVEPGEEVTFNAQSQNATGNISYRWEDESGTVLGTGSSFSRTYNDEGSYRVNIFASDDNGDVESFCRATVSYEYFCDNSNTAGTRCIDNTMQTVSCVLGEWVTTDTGLVCTQDAGGSFSLNPNIVPTGGNCGVQLNMSNVSTCSIMRNGVNYMNLDTYIVDGKINTQQGSVTVPPGRYSVTCTGIGEGAATQTTEPKSCVSNPNIMEN